MVEHTEPRTRAVDISSITEIAEYGRTRANLCIENGYTLLGIFAVAEPIEKKGQFYVRRSVLYVVGRTTDVQHYDPPKPEPREAQEQPS